jgi:hypothetical protein
MGIERLQFVVPEVWDASWFRRVFVAEILSKLDTRNATGTGVTVSSNGNSVASLATEVTQATVDASINAHRAEIDPHSDLIDDLPAVTAVAETDLVIVSQSGTNKQATVDQLATAVFGEEWDDLRFPMNSVDPTGIVGAATRITSLTGYTGALSFAGNAENVCAGIAQMPHAWKRESAIRPHIHWTKPTGSANAVTWQLYLRVVGNPGDTAGAWSAALTPAGTIGDQTVNDEHLLTYWSPFAMTGLIESAIVYWRLHRLGNTDADNSDVICHELDFHYQTDKAGTEAEIPS